MLRKTYVLEDKVARAASVRVVDYSRSLRTGEERYTLCHRSRRGKSWHFLLCEWSDALSLYYLGPCDQDGQPHDLSKRPQRLSKYCQFDYRIPQLIGRTFIRKMGPGWGWFLPHDDPFRYERLQGLQIVTCNLPLETFPAKVRTGISKSTGELYHELCFQGRHFVLSPLPELDEIEGIILSEGPCQGHDNPDEWASLADPTLELTTMLEVGTTVPAGTLLAPRWLKGALPTANLPGVQSRWSLCGVDCVLLDRQSAPSRSRK